MTRIFWQKVVSAIVLFAAATLALPAMAQPGDTLTIGVAAPPTTMNPHGRDADSNLSIMANIFNGLLQRNTQGKLEPALATSWERVDPLTWRFKLRQGVTFHNGNDFTWEDVKFTMNRLSDPKVSEFLAFGGLVDTVKPVDGDPWTIEIKTVRPVPLDRKSVV